MRKLYPQETEALEQIMDRCGLKELLRCIASICAEKAEHVATTWQDQPLADAWTEAQMAIEQVADREFRRLPN